MDKRITSNYLSISDGWSYQKELMGLPQPQLTNLELISFYNYQVSKHSFYKHQSNQQNIQEIDQIPIIDKVQVLDNMDQFYDSTPIKQLEVNHYIENFDITNTFNNYLVFHSSGSSGRRSITLYNQFEFGRSLYALYEKTLKPFGSQRIAYIGLTDRYNGGNQWMYHLCDPLEVALINFFDCSEDQIKELSEFKPDVIFTKPSKLIELGREMRANGIKLDSLNHIISVGENLSHYAEKEIHSLFGIRPRNSFSTTETGPIGFQCSNERELDLYDSLNYVEIIDEDGQPINEPNKPGRLVVTNLYNLTFPLIRYDLADYVYWIDGKVGKSISFILGRADKLIQFGSDKNKIVVNELELWKFHHDHLQDCQFNIISKDLVTVYAVLVHDTPSEKVNVTKQINQFFRNLGVPKSVIINIEFVNAIKADSESSKTKRVVIQKAESHNTERV